MPDKTDLLIQAITSIGPVQAVGESHSQIEPAQGVGSDRDLFIYCSEIPSQEERRNAIAWLEVEASGVEIEKQAGVHWGHADCLVWQGIQTWLMYFTVQEARDELEEILAGKYPDRIDGDFYPVGRCAMYNKMIPLYDPQGVLASFRDSVKQFPSRLVQAVLDCHLAGLEDTEDLDRAVLRKDVLFYHFALDTALDHFLQALFAFNRVYFPSRKRSLETMRNFERKPEGCEQRLLQIVAWGSRAEDLGRSREAWEGLVKEFVSDCRL